MCDINAKKKQYKINHKLPGYYNASGCNAPGYDAILLI